MKSSLYKLEIWPFGNIPIFGTVSMNLVQVSLDEQRQLVSNWLSQLKTSVGLKNNVDQS